MSSGIQTRNYGDDEELVPIETIRVEVIDGPDAGSVREAISETLSVGTAEDNDLVLTDETVSRYHLELVRGDEGIRLVDPGSTNGSYVAQIRIADGIVPTGTKIRLGATTLRLGPGAPQQVELYPEERLADLVGGTPAMRRLMDQIAKAARTASSALIIGESGTGKELIARALHELGPRVGKPFETVDCGALAPNLVASELFGHERGAFTGAERKHVGAFERADGGTLFLDELGELPPDLQSMLLGALERRRFRRVGGTEEISVDVRVIAATHRDLRERVNEGKFRLDLYYRLAVVRLKVPALRERVEDIPRLVRHFLRELGETQAMVSLFDEESLTGLMRHSWPGNVRELRNVVEATLALGEAPGEFLEEDLRPASGDAEAISVRPVYGLPFKEARDIVQREFERIYLAHHLARADGNVAAAARNARMDRSHLFHLLRRHELR